MRYRFRVFGGFGRGGFTLLELIVVLFVVSVSASIVVLYMSRAHEKAALRDSLRKLQSALREARDIALMERTPVEFKVDEKNASYRIEKNGKRHGAAVSMPKKVELEGRDIVFYPKGNSSGGTILIRHSDGRRYRIVIEAVTGIARIERI